MADKKLTELVEISTPVLTTDLMYIVRPSLGTDGSKFVPVANLPVSAHTHVFGDVPGLQTALDGKLATSAQAADVNPAGTAIAAALATKAPTSHTHAISAVSGLQDALDAKLATNGTAADVNPGGTSISAALATKAPTSHTHPAAQISDSTATGRSVLTAADAAAARTAIGAGTSSFSGAYADLSGRPALGDAALKNTGTGAGEVAAGNHTHSGLYEPVQTPATQAEAEAGTETGIRSFSPLRVKQAIAALAGTGSGTIAGSTGAVDNAILRADGTGGSTLQSSAASVDDAGKVSADAVQLSVTPTTVVGAGTIVWNADQAAPQVGFNATVSGLLGVNNHVQVVNQTGSPMTKGQVVRQNGSSGVRLRVALAQADGDPQSATTVGVLVQDIANNQTGFIVTSGLVSGINTGAFTAGDVLWLSGTTAGAITNVRPVQPYHGVRIGYCIKSSVGAGEILVDVLNGFELDELHDVLISASPADNSLLVYETSSGLWKNEAPADARTSLGLGTLATQNGTFSGTSSGVNTGDQTISLTGDVTGSGTGSFAATIAAGSVNTTKLGGDITAAGKALLDDATAAAQRTTLGLGTLATQSGTFSGTSSGVNTGDQTITLTGDVTGSGTGSFAVTIADEAVSYAKMQLISQDAKLLGRGDSGFGPPEEISIGSGLVMTGTTLSATGGGGGGSLSPWALKTSAYTAVDGDRLLADTTAGAFTITLPASPAVGQYVEINDAEETWPTNNLTVARNGSNIDSLAENLVCNITAKIGLTYIDATIGWKVDFIAEIGGAGGSSQADSDSNIIANLVFS
jgi:hypothetical protein